MKISHFLKRAMLLLLAAALVFSVTACNGGNGGGGDSSTIPIPGEGSFDDVVDMNGYVFTAVNPFLLDSPDLNKVTYAEKIFEEVRRKVEKEYNCTIKIVNPDTADLVSNLKTKVMSGDKVGDLYNLYALHLIPSIRNGVLQDMSKINGLDVKDPRWVEAITNVATYDGGVYALEFMRPTEVRTSLIYNKQVLNNMGIKDDITQLVRDKKWTFDKWREILKACTKDTNGDGENDVWGLMSHASTYFLWSLIASNNGRVLDVHEDGSVTETLNDEKVINALQFYYDIINTDKVFDKQATEESANLANDFLSGKYAFVSCETWLIDQHIKKLNTGNVPYGLVPVPMGPDATDYASNADNMRMWSITTTNKDLDKTVPIFNALARYTYNYGEDHWWDDGVEYDYFNDGDKDSVEMYNLTLEKSVIDYGHMVPDLASEIEQQIRVNVILKRRGTIASAVNSLHGTFNEAISARFNVREG